MHVSFIIYQKNKRVYDVLDKESFSHTMSKTRKASEITLRTAMNIVFPTLSLIFTILLDKTRCELGKNLHQ